VDANADRAHSGPSTELHADPLFDSDNGAHCDPSAHCDGLQDASDGQPDQARGGCAYSGGYGEAHSNGRRLYVRQLHQGEYQQRW
jgi:hypothetical protein